MDTLSDITIDNYGNVILLPWMLSHLRMITRSKRAYIFYESQKIINTNLFRDISTGQVSAFGQPYRLGFHGRYPPQYLELSWSHINTFNPSAAEPISRITLYWAKNTDLIKNRQIRRWVDTQVYIDRHPDIKPISLTTHVGSTTSHRLVWLYTPKIDTVT